MRRMWPLLCLLTACAVKSPLLLQQRENLEDQHRSFAQGKAKEPLLPDPLEVYEKQLKQDLERFSEDRRAVLGPSAILGIAHYYHRQLELFVRYCLSQAQGHLKTGEFPRSEAYGHQALEILNGRARFPRFLAVHSRETHSLLEGIYRKQGSLGKALLSKLNIDLLTDYSRSEQGIRDLYLERQAHLDALQQTGKIDRFIFDVNVQRKDENLQRWNRIAAVTAVAGSIIQQASIDRALKQSGGQVTPEIRMMQFNKTLLDINAGALIAKSGMQGLGATLNPMSNLTLIGQLVDPKMGVNPFGIIKNFTDEAAKLDPALDQAAKGVSQLADTLADTRKKGDPEKTKAGAQNFIKVFTEFQARVQEVR